MSSIPATHVIQVTNVSPAATLEQMKELFGYLGRIRDIKLYPSEDCIFEPESRVCYVEYYEKWSVGVAQHLTNTVFIDRALIVVPLPDEGIPCESTALALTNPTSALPGLVFSGSNALINEISGVDGSLVITTIDPKLTALGLPQYPPLPAHLDPVKIEEIRRTITVGNFDSSVSADNLLKYFNQIGEVKFLRMGGDLLESSKVAFVEFTDQSTVPKVLQYNGITFDGKPLTINHSTCAIVKPLPKTPETQKEIDEAMKRVKEAQSLITAVVEPELPGMDKSHRRKSRSRSHGRSTSEARFKHKRSRSRSKRSRSRQSRGSHVSRTPSRHSRHKSRSKSRDRKKVSPHKKGRSHSHSREAKKVNSRYKKSRSRSHSREKSKRSHRTQSRSPSKSSSNSRSKKSNRSKEEVENREQGRMSSRKEEKSKTGLLLQPKSSHKKNSQSNEMYDGPSLLVPEVNIKGHSKSPVKKSKQSSKHHSRSPVKSTKYLSSKSHSRSPVSGKEKKYKRARSRSQSDKRSRSRSKGTSKKKHSPSRHSSRSVTPSRKQGSYSPGHSSVTRHLNSEKHSVYSRKRSLTPKRKSRTPPERMSRSPAERRSGTPPKKRSPTPPRMSSITPLNWMPSTLPDITPLNWMPSTLSDITPLNWMPSTLPEMSELPIQYLQSPVQQSMSPVYRTRSPSPQILIKENSPSMLHYRSSISPKMPSPSPEGIVFEQKQNEFLEEVKNTITEPLLNVSCNNSDNIIGSQIPCTYDQENVCSLEGTMLQNANENIQYDPNVYDYYSSYNSVDMDLGSD